MAYPSPNTFMHAHTAKTLWGSLTCQKVTQVELGGSCWRSLPEWYWFYDPGCLVPPPEASYWLQVLVWWHKPLMIIEQCQERRTRWRWTLCGSPNVQNGRDRRQLGLGSVVTLMKTFQIFKVLNVVKYKKTTCQNAKNPNSIHVSSCQGKHFGYQVKMNLHNTSIKTCPSMRNGL